MKVPGYGSRYLEDPSAKLTALLSRDSSVIMGFFKFLTGRASGYFFMISRTRFIAGRPIFLKSRLSIPYIIIHDTVVFLLLLFGEEKDHQTMAYRSLLREEGSTATANVLSVHP